jgi:hypothetical protein
LNDVLSQIPPDVLQKMALTKILRGGDVGAIDPNDQGEYIRYDKGTIIIYDKAKTNILDFPNDSSGDTEFKAVIVHELTHALQRYIGPGENASSDPYQSQLVKDYIEATRPNDPSPLNILGNGWTLTEGKWQLRRALPDNMPPTQYGLTNPLDDMADSTMMYVNDPQRLKYSSQKRYDFIKDKVFGGVEYENGVQKKP